MVQINWNELQKAAGEAGFGVVPRGEYDVVVEKCDPGKTNDGSKDRFRTRFKITSGPHSGNTLLNDFTISPENANALGFFFRHMAALGLNSAYFGTNPSSEQIARDLVGRRCRADVIIDNWGGQERNKISNIKPPGNGPSTGPGATPPGPPLAQTPQDIQRGLAEFASPPSQAPHHGPMHPASPPASVPAPPAPPAELPF
jgi:Protein of unknown function (DUF669)